MRICPLNVSVPRGSRAAMKLPAAHFTAGWRLWCWCTAPSCLICMQNCPRGFEEHPGGLLQAWNMNEHLSQQQRFLPLPFSFLLTVFTAHCAHRVMFAATAVKRLSLWSLVLVGPMNTEVFRNTPLYIRSREGSRYGSMNQTSVTHWSSSNNCSTWAEAGGPRWEVQHSCLCVLSSVTVCL